MREIVGIEAGHSFAKRHRRFSLPSHPYNRDIYSVSEAKLYANALDLDNTYDQIYTISQNIYTIEDFKSENSNRIRNIRPDVLNCYFGSNDIASLTSHTPNTVLSLATKLVRTLQEVAAPVTIVNEVLPRTSNISSSANDYRQNANLFNQIMRNFDNSKILQYLQTGATYYVE